MRPFPVRIEPILFEAATIKFVAFTLFSVGVFVFGYVGRDRGWIDEQHSRTIHWHTVVWAWSLGALVSVWKLPIEWASVWLLPMLVVLIALPMVVMSAVVGLMGLPRHRAGVMVLGAGFSNLGFTLGAYLCYVLITDDRALGYAGSLMAVFNVTMVLLGYPVARYYGGAAGEGQRLLSLMRQSFVAWSAMPIYASLAGLVLSVLAVPFPMALERFGVIDVLMFATAFGGYLGVGMRVRLGGLKQYGREHGLMAGFKFGLAPMLAWVVVWVVSSGLGGIHATAAQVYMIDALMPTGIAMVILANIFHLDARFAGMIWFWNTLFFCVFVLPVMVGFMA